MSVGVCVCFNSGQSERERERERERETVSVMAQSRWAHTPPASHMTHTGTAEQNIKHMHTHTHTHTCMNTGHVQNGGVRITVFAFVALSYMSSQRENNSSYNGHFRSENMSTSAKTSVRGYSGWLQVKRGKMKIRKMGKKERWKNEEGDQWVEKQDRGEEKEDWLHQRWPPKSRLCPIPFLTQPPFLQPPPLQGISRARSEHSEAKLCHCKRNEISQSAVPAEWL